MSSKINESQGFIPDPQGNSKPFVLTGDAGSMPMLPSELSALPANNINALRTDSKTSRPAVRYGERPEGSKPRPCRPTVVPFDTEKYINIYLRLEYLKNLDSEDLPHPGDYVVRVMCMGELYGHYPSGSMDLQSMVNYARNDTNSRRCPDVFLSHEISICIKFKDLVDNPIVFHLCNGGEIIPDMYHMLQPFGYICLDVARLLNYKTGILPEHVEPWVIPDLSKANGLSIATSKSAASPSLQLTLECIGGLPDSKQLLQGNMMTVLCESLHNMPPYVQQALSHAENITDVHVFMTLPHSQTDSVLKFPGGKYKESFMVEVVHKKLSFQDEATQTTLGLFNEGEGGGANKSSHELSGSNNGNQVHVVQIPQAPRYWASVKENNPEMPMEATVMPFDPALDNPVTTEESEVYGDGREDYMEFTDADDGILWNSVHKKYIAVDSYRNMLGKLSQNAIWPIEISIAVKKKSDGKKKKTEKGKSGVQSQLGPASTDRKISAASIPVVQDSNERMIMSELGQMSGSGPNSNEFTLVYHGIAFVDLSCLVYPGTKSARFACRIQPFSQDLLAKRTCVTNSAVPPSLLRTLIPKSGVENKLKPQQKQQQTPVQAGGTGGQLGKPQGQGQRASVLQGSYTPEGSMRKSDFNEVTKMNKTPGVEISFGDAASGSQERYPFIVFRISMLRSIVPCYKSSEISKVVNEFLPRRQLMRRKLLNASTAQQKYRKAVLEAAAELSHEFSEHYWKEVLQNGQTTQVDRATTDPSSNEAVKKGFIFYLNASGRYLILREHLRSAISNVVQQKCLNLRPSGFHNHRDFQSYLHDMYVYLVDEMHDILNSSSLQETDPLKSSLDRLLQQTNCGPEEEFSKASLHQRQITDLGIFAEEAFAQGDFDTCHRLHLQRICKDKESARCWTEFAIMWLSRGDDRMAEIAVREALRKDPLHLYALIISGVISVRHGDERGIECLGAALGLRPMAPEILVIVGVANSLIGNDIAADYFFRKAAFVHRIITGQSTEDLDKLFNEKNTKRPFNMKEFTKDMEEDVLSVAPSVTVPVVVPEENSNVSDQPQQQGEGPGEKKDRSKTKVRKSKDTVSNGKRKTSKLKNINPGEDQQGPDANANEDQMKRLPSKGRKSSSAKEARMSQLQQNGGGGVPPPESVSNSPSSGGTGPKFTFLENLNDILPEEVEMPWLSPSIQSPWNVTEYSDKMNKLILSGNYPKANKAAKEQVVGGGAGGDAGSQHSQAKSNVSLANSNPDEEGEDGQNGEDEGNGSGSLDSSSDKPLKEGAGSNSTFASSVGASNDPSGQSTQMSKDTSNTKSKGQVKGGKEEMKFSSSMMSHLPPGAGQPKLTDRLGSELIWAANLLINLRLFDFLDGVLAKQLYFYEKRTIQFIYLRALSFYLRQREEEALPLIREAIEIDNKNGIYWALEGHCNYNLGNIPEAMTSYEKALKLPHTHENRHLLYLRYGSLVLDSGKTKLAKRVFLHGVSKYPTPYMWLALGSACFQRLEYDQAESSFSEANRLDSTNPITWGHLALSSLMQNKQALAEQAYKWALRFGLKKGILMDEIQRVQKEKGFGDPSFPRVPTCVPHEYYLRRLGKQKPFNIYREALNQDPPRMNRDRYDDTENEALLKRKLEMIANASMIYGGEGDEWEGEGYYRPFPHTNQLGTVPEVEEEVEVESAPPQPSAPETMRAKGKRGKSEKGGGKHEKHSAPPDLVTIKNPPSQPPTSTA